MLFEPGFLTYISLETRVAIPPDGLPRRPRRLRARHGDGSTPDLHRGTELRQRKSKTIRALICPFSTASKHSLTSSSLRLSLITRVRP